jgi:methionyl aminopeptidase
MYKIPIKTKKEIEAMREGGAILGQMLRELKDLTKVSTDVWDLEEYFIRMCESKNVIPACRNYAPKGFPPFPTGLCIGINDQAVHCFPVKGRVLDSGDIITLDTVIKYKNMYVDSALTFGVGKVSKKHQKLLDITQKALDESIKVIKPGIRVGKISETMQGIVEKEGYSVLRDYAGHGIGRDMHEPPEIPCYGDSTQGYILSPGITLAVEPLVCEKNYILEHNNYWETNTLDGGIFVQMEHTVLVTEKGHEILTK